MYFTANYFGPDVLSSRHSYGTIKYEKNILKDASYQTIINKITEILSFYVKLPPFVLQLSPYIDFYLFILSANTIDFSPNDASASNFFFILLYQDTIGAWTNGLIVNKVNNSR